MKTIAFVYKWVHLPTKKWYIGSRTKKGCNTNDGYICSSKIVKPLILKSQSEWVREIIAVGTPEEMLQLEHKLLVEQDAKNNNLSFNMHNGDGKFSNSGICHSPETRSKISASNKGKPRLHSAEVEEKRIAKVREVLLGKPQSADHIMKRSRAMTGKIQTPEHINKRADAIRAYHKNKLKDSGVFS